MSALSGQLAPPERTMPAMRASRKRWAWLISAVLAIVVAAFVIGMNVGTASTPKTKPVAASAAPPAAPGQTVAWKDALGNTGTITISSPRRVQPQPQYDEHPAAGSWLVVDVTVQVTKGTAEVDYMGFEAQGADGLMHQGTSAPLTDDAEMLSTGLAAGRSVSGQVGFDIPAGHALVDWEAAIGPPLATFSVQG
jgi:hypothetical protein